MAKREKLDVGILFYEEGYAETLLYKKIIEWCITNSNKKYKIKHKNLKGEGNTQQIPNFYKINILPERTPYTVFFCYDIDVSKRPIGRKPSIRWNNAKRQLKELGVKKIFEIKQDPSIEQLLLKDLPGILRYLGLPESVKVVGKGDEALKWLYGQAGKVYVHSNQIMMQRLIDSLNISSIISQSKDLLRPLLELYNL